MKQEFTKLEDGKIRWDMVKEDSEYTDKDLGRVGIAGNTQHIIFDNKKKAAAVLDRDIEEVTALMNQHKELMDKNVYDEEKFKLIKPVVDAVGKLHNDFNNVQEMPAKINGANMLKYLKVIKEFNKAKDFIKEELSAFNKEYGKYLQYGPAKVAYDFANEQLDKIVKQRKLLEEL